MRLPFSRTWWIEPGKIIGGRFPGTLNPEESRQMLTELIGCGVRTIINLQQEDERGNGGVRFRDYRPELAVAAAALAAEVECHRLPIRDWDIPRPELMAMIQAVIRDSVDAGKVVFVHCWGGHGRTGTVAGCWMREGGATADEALHMIQQRRMHDPHLSEIPAPQTDAQRRFVEAWKAPAGIASGGIRIM